MESTAGMKLLEENKPVNQLLSNDPSLNSSTEEKYASVVYRYAAVMLDGLILGVALIPLAILLMMGGVDQESTAFNLLGALVSAVYSIYFINKQLATPGKKFFKLKIEVLDGQPMTATKAFMREVVGKFLSGLILGIGYVWAIFDKRKQSWHDKIANTVVVQTEPLSTGRKFIAYFLAFGLIILAILGILAVVVLVSINPSEQLARTRDSGRIAAVTQIGYSVESYYMQNNAYPADTSWNTDLVASGHLEKVPDSIEYTKVDECSSALKPYQGYCYKTELGIDPIVYARLESEDYNSKCNKIGQKAYVLYSAAIKNGGVWCGASEPLPGSVFDFILLREI